LSRFLSLPKKGSLLLLSKVRALPTSQEAELLPVTEQRVLPEDANQVYLPSMPKVASYALNVKTKAASSLSQADAVASLFAKFC
jgi:hypothetical protein